MGTRSLITASMSRWQPISLRRGGVKASAAAAAVGAVGVPGCRDQTPAAPIWVALVSALIDRQTACTGPSIGQPTFQCAAPPPDPFIH